MPIHKAPHPQAGQTVKLIDGTPYQLEDWWDRVSGGSWMHAVGNPACLRYATRSGVLGNRVPIDNEVVYGKIDGMGLLIHVSEIAESNG